MRSASVLQKEPRAPPVHLPHARETREGRRQWRTKHVLCGHHCQREVVLPLRVILCSEAASSGSAATAQEVVHGTCLTGFLFLL